MRSSRVSLVILEHAHLAFGGKEILADSSLRIVEGDRIGVVGQNGSGKSTLLRVLCGRQGLDGGQVRLARHVTLGYLPQDVLEVGGATLLSSVMDSIPGRAGVERDLEEAEVALERSADPEEQLRLARVLSTLHERLERYETYFSESRAAAILSGLGFRPKDSGRPTTEFSGGWKMRAALAALLFQGPDVLLLDEPTNHLDVPSVAWLDEFLGAQKSAVVLICHDRTFLNRHVERIVSFEPEGVRAYPGNYDDYKVQRQSEEEILEASARNQEARIRELERFVERFRAKATKARQAQSRARLIEKMEKEIDRPVLRPRALRFTFPEIERTGRDVLRLDGVSKRFGELRLYDRLSRSIFAGDRVAIVGVNGAGKTTLLKMMAGELPPDGGQVQLGANVRLGYYAQHHTELLDPKRTVLEEVWRVNPGAGQSYVRSVCGAFLFSGDEVDKAVGVLSGGERARVLLARLLVKPCNLLLMDEPTNHLDIASAEALAEALGTFGGTLVLVSHNRSFVNHLATKVWEIDEGELTEHLGDLDAYLERKSLGAPAGEGGALEAVSPDGGRRGGGGGAAPRKSQKEERERKRREAERRGELSKRTKALRGKIAETEARIAEIEAEQRDLEPRLADPELYRDAERSREMVRRFEENKRTLEQLVASWERGQEELEKVRAEAAEDGRTAKT
jgi:ATP-binding cassette, subfamily F, member 3